VRRRRRAERRRGGAARGVPGPALPGRDRLPATAALRYRTGRAAARLSARSPRHARREVLGFHLEKGHSAADWSVRPLREELLRYAALDVEVLTDLRDALAGELEE